MGSSPKRKYLHHNRLLHRRQCPLFDLHVQNLVCISIYCLNFEVKTTNSGKTMNRVVVHHLQAIALLEAAKG